MDKALLLDTINNQFVASRDATAQRRMLMRDRLKLYINTNKTDDKISLYLVRAYANTLISLYFEDWLKQEFMSRDLYSYLEADNLNAAANFDYDEMKMSSKDYLVQKHRILHGLACRVWTNWNYDLQHPEYKIIHPLMIFPDPLGHSEITNFRYFGFETITSLDEMEDMGYENVDLVHSYLTSDLALSLTEMGLPHSVNLNETITTLQAMYKKSKETTIFNQYMMIDWDPYQVVCFANNIILSAKKIEPIASSPAAKSKLKFPIALNYFEPDEWTPFGINLFDILEDKQKNKTLLTNLIRIKTIREALWGDTLIDSEVLKMNKSILSTSSVGRRYIPVSDTAQRGLSNMVYNVQEDKISPDAYSLREILDQEAQSDSWIDSTVRGLSSWQGITATEAKTKQLNANVNLVLGNTINSRGERDFRLGWYYMYKHYLPEDSKKIVRLKRGLTSTGQLFRRKDLISGVDPDVTIQNKSRAEQQRKEEWEKFLNYLPMLLSDPATKPISRRFLQRKSLRIQGLTSQEIEIAVPYTPEEMEAKQHLFLLNKNIPVNVWDLSEDHYTYLTIYAGALDTEAKRAAMDARKEAYIESGQNQQQAMMEQSQPWGWGWGMMGAMANQALANQFQNSKQVPSNQGIR